MKVETKVGLLFIISFMMIAVFSYALGVFTPFSNSHDINLLYNFAGGIEIGSPVRVMGIKVGKVKEIRFDPSMKSAQGEETKLIITVDIEKKAWSSIREDSKFFINLAGVIGEKFIEITPGTVSSAELKPNGYYRGEDPPRIDQLISQSYSLAGKVLDFVERNEGDVMNTIKSLESLVSNLNKAMVLLDKATSKPQVAQLAELLANLNQISGDVASVSGKLRGKEAKETIDLIHRLLWRLDDLDKAAIKKFLQEEGIKAKLF